jgi:hypothetical protein
MMTLEVTPEFPEALTLPEQAKAITITNAETYTQAANFKITLAGWRKKIVDEFAPMKEAAHKAHKAITAKEGEYLKPITEAEATLKAAIVKWQDEQEAIRRAEQRRLEMEAQMQRDLERQRLEEEALNAAIAEGTEEVYVEPVAYVPPPIAAPTYEPVKGLGITRRWGAEVTDIKKLCRAVADGVVPETYVLPNMPALNSRAQADKQSLLIPGVRSAQK